MAKKSPSDFSHGELVNKILWHLRDPKKFFLWKNQTGAAKVDDRWITYGFKGSADIIGLKLPGTFIAIECKVGKDYQKPAQKSFQLAVEKLGGIYLLARSLSDVDSLLAE